MIRLLTANDASDYKAVRLKALQTDGQYYQSTYDLERTQSDHFFAQQLHQAVVSPIFGYYGYYVDDQLAGYIQLEYLWSPKKQHSAKLTNLYVDPTYRGKGIGTKLFDHVTALAKEHGLEQLSLQCSASNTAAQKLYAQQGFEIYGRKKNAIKWQGEYDDVVLLSKEL